MNRVVLVGRLTKDPELRKTNSGNSVVRFILAVNRRYKKEGEQDADFVSCIAWNKIAENMEVYLSKGSLISIDGRIQTGSYENQSGQRVYTTDVVCDNVDFLESKSRENQTQNTQQDKPVANNQNNNPTNDFFADFETNNTNSDILSNLEVSDDELPF